MSLHLRNQALQDSEDVLICFHGRRPYHDPR